MKSSILVGVLLFSVGFAANAQGHLEIPTPGYSASGIVAISGWHCTARRVEIVIDNLPALPAGSGTERSDTSAVCGRVDTGFSLLFNVNTLAKGAHTIVALADGVEFVRRPFHVYHSGAEFMTGVVAYRQLRNFPGVDQTAAAQWQEEMQNFSIDGWFSTKGVAGTYYGAVGNQCLLDLPSHQLADSQFATFVVSLSADKRDLSLRIQYADGTSCSMSGDAQLAPDGYLVVTRPVTTCPVTGSLRIEVDGLRLKGQLGTVRGAQFGCPIERVFFGAAASWRD